VVGWATVELDRAEVEVGGSAEFGSALGRGPVTSSDVPPDRTLGAACRILRSAEGLEVVLLEPSTEGLLAAGLARHGEGSLVAYLLSDRGAVERARRGGFTVASERDGPFGRQRLVLAGQRDGPFLVLVGLPDLDG
jgi:hypothetical protein